MQATVTRNANPGTLMQASHQWATRPADERFTSLADLHAHTTLMRRNSNARTLSNRAISAVPVNDDPTHKGLVLQGPSGNTVNISNWAMTQLASRAGAPAGYLRNLPAPLAADCLNYGLHVNRDVEELGVLLTANPDSSPTLRAATGPNYGRIWNETVTGALLRRFGPDSGWTVPGEFGRAVEVTKANTTLFASDRDMFVFLADEQNRIEVPNRRNGQAGSMARGIFFWNSEVGSGTLGMASFLFDYVCCNRIVWGAKDYTELKIRHTSGAPDRWIEQALPAIEDYAHSSTASIERTLEQAQRQRIDNVDAFLAARFSRPQANAIKVAHTEDEGRPIETLWDAATAVTAYARGITYQDDRVALEREGGRILDLAA